MAEKAAFSRKDLKNPDAFMVAVGRLNRLLGQHRRSVVGAATALLLLFGAGLGWSTLRSRALDSTAAAFLRATYALESHSPETAKAGLKNVAERSYAPYDVLARFYTADLATTDGDPATALRAYDELLTRVHTPYLKQLALLGKGYVLEGQGEAVKAVEAYAGAAGLSGPYREQALRAELRTATAVGDKSHAGAAIEKILENYPQSPDADELSERLATVRDSP